MRPRPPAGMGIALLGPHNGKRPRTFTVLGWQSGRTVHEATTAASTFLVPSTFTNRCWRFNRDRRWPTPLSGRGVFAFRTPQPRLRGREYRLRGSQRRGRASSGRLARLEYTRMFPAETPDKEMNHIATEKTRTTNCQNFHLPSPPVHASNPRQRRCRESGLWSPRANRPGPWKHGTTGVTRAVSLPYWAYAVSPAACCPAQVRRSLASPSLPQGARLGCIRP